VIVGLGIDVVDISGFREQISDPASTFVHGTFTAAEIADASGRPGGEPARHLAARWAAKEAWIKAWSSSRFGEPPLMSQVDMREIEVRTDAWCRPKLCVHGAVAQAAGNLVARVSLSHDGGYAAAVVVLERA